MLVSINEVKKWYLEHSVLVGGEKGAGKDVLQGNVIARIDRPYVSNIDYTKDGRFIPLNFKDIDCGGNTWKNFLTGKVNKYVPPFPDGTNVYISDLGIYLPSQYDSEIDEEVGELATYMALARHVCKGQVSGNAQNIERPWKKFREQCEVFIVCKWCYVIFGVVIAHFVKYERLQSAVDKVPPFPFKEPIFIKRSDSINVELEKAKYQISHGEITPCTYICINKSKHDDRAFKTILENGDAEHRYTEDYFNEHGMFKGPRKKKQKKGSDFNAKDKNFLPY